MKAAPTLDGRLRIDAESEADVFALKSVVVDAGDSPENLAEDVGGLMPLELSEDWTEIILPELHGHFREQVTAVARSVKDVTPGDTVFIGKEDAELWYGALNQARLSLESRYKFENRPFDDMDPEQRNARIRSHFYQVVQGLILDFLMDA